MKKFIKVYIFIRLCMAITLPYYGLFIMLLLSIDIS